MKAMNLNKFKCGKIRLHYQTIYELQVSHILPPPSFDKEVAVFLLRPYFVFKKRSIKVKINQL